MNSLKITSFKIPSWEIITLILIMIGRGIKWACCHCHTPLEYTNFHFINIEKIYIMASEHTSLPSSLFLSLLFPPSRARSNFSNSDAKNKSATAVGKMSCKLLPFCFSFLYVKIFLIWGNLMKKILNYKFIELTPSDDKDGNLFFNEFIFSH